MRDLDWRLLAAVTLVAFASYHRLCRADDAAPIALEQAPRQSLEAKLAVRVDLTPHNVPLQAYLEEVARKHDVPLRFDAKRILGQSIPLDRPISGDVRAFPLKAGLARLLRKYGLEPRIEGDVLVIGTLAPQRVARPGAIPARVVVRDVAINARAVRVRLQMNDQFKAVLANPLFARDLVLQVDEQDEGQFNAEDEVLRRQIAREHFYRSFNLGDSAEGLQKRLQDLLDGQIHHTRNEWDLSDGQQRKLRLAGQGDIENLISQVETACDRFTDVALTGVRLVEIPSDDCERLQFASTKSFEEMFGPDSMFAKVRERTLTEEQRATRSAIIHLRSTGAIVRTRTSQGQGIREVFLALRKIDKLSMTHLASLKHLEQVSLSSTTIEDRDLALLKDLKELKSLDLSMTVIGDAGLAHLEELTRLEDLDLRRTNVSDRGLTSLRKMRKLRTLDLSETACGDAGLGNLRGLSHLESLNLSGLPITDAGLALLGIEEMAGLRELRLSNSSLGKKGLAALSRLRRLERLELNGVNLRETGVGPLSELTALRVLYLDHTEIDDDDLVALSKLVNLERLDLQRTHVTDRGLSQLSELQQLRSLDLWGTKTTKDGTSALEAAIPRLRIIR